MFSGGTQRRAFASTPERRNENINVNKYLISSSGDRTHNQSVYRHTLCPCATTNLEILQIIDLIKNNLTIFKLHIIKYKIVINQKSKNI